MTRVMIISPRFFSMLSLAISCMVFSSSCSSGKKKKVRSSIRSESSRNVAEPDDDDDVSLAGNKRTLTYSMSNNSLTSARIKKSSAKNYADKLRGSTKKATRKDKLKLEAAVAAGAIGGVSFGEVLAASKRLMSVELAQSVNNKLPDYAKLQLAIAALQTGRYNMADHFMSQLESSKNARIRATVFNMEGLLALREKRLPEAVAFWKKSLKAVSNYKPALLNIGFLALKYGDSKTAKKMLGNFQSDWFALYGLLVAERVSGNVSRVEGLCTRVLSQKPDYKPALLSCALNKYQGKGQFSEAKKLLNKLVKSKNGPSVIDERAYRLISAIQKEEAANAKAKAQAKASKAKAAAKAKAKANAKAKAKAAAKAKLTNPPKK